MRTVYLFIFSITIIFIHACQKADIKYGQQYIDNGLTNIVLVDSIAPAVSTVFKDSVITSQTGIVLAGSYKDPYFGTVNTSSFLPLSPATNSIPELLPGAQYDSLAVLMTCDGSYYGDTSLPSIYTVTTLNSEISLGDQAFFYNTASWPASSTPLGSAVIGLRPLNKDTAHIRLTDGLGITLFRMIRQKSDTLKNNIVFSNYFKGIKISTLNSNAIVGFKDSVTMRLYYHETDLYRQNKYFDFKLSDRSLQFNHIDYDRTSTTLAALNTSNKEIASTQTDNAGYMQSATGLYIKISFPAIRQILQRPDFIKLVKATLIIKPVAGSYNGLYPLPPELVAATTDGLNQPGGTLAIGTSPNLVIENGNLVQDPLYQLNTNYSYDVTSYLAAQLSLTGINQNGLLMIPPAANRSGFNRLTIADAYNKNTASRIQLKLYYVSVIH